MTTWQKFWDALPAQVRSVVNVLAGAAVTALVGYVAANYGHLNLNEAWQVVLAALGTAASTVLVRTVNPADTTYGAGAPPAAGE